MLLVVAALRQEVNALLALLQRNAARVLEDYSLSACFSTDLRNHEDTKPTLALFDIDLRGQTLRVGVLITKVGKVASAWAVSAACALYNPHALLCIGCALDLAQGKQRENHESASYALACVATTVQHDVNCLQMPRIKVQHGGAKKAYKKCDYGEFLDASTEYHPDKRLYRATLSLARTCACVHDVPFYENAALLSGDVFVPHAQPSSMPDSVRVLSSRMAQQYDMLLLDMESAAVFATATAFAVPSVAFAVVLDSIAEPSPIMFSQAMSKISHILSDLVVKIFDLVGELYNGGYEF